MTEIKVASPALVPLTTRRLLTTTSETYHWVSRDAAPATWNDLPLNTRRCDSIHQFKRLLKLTYSKELLTRELWRTINIVARLDFLCFQDLFMRLFIYYPELFLILLRS